MYARLQLSYADHRDNAPGSRFSIEGLADSIDPVMEPASASGQRAGRGWWETCGSHDRPCSGRDGIKEISNRRLLGRRPGITALTT